MPAEVDIVAQGHVPDTIDLVSEDYLTHIGRQVKLTVFMSGSHFMCGSLPTSHAEKFT